MEQVKCYSCGESHWKSVEYGKSSKKLQSKFKEILICSNCGMGQVFPGLKQSELDSFYSDGNYWSAVTISKGLKIHNYEQSLNRCSRVLEFIQNKNDGIRVLDVGAGEGSLLEALRSKLTESKIHYSYIEHDEACIDIIKKIKLDGSVKVSSFSQDKKESFDVIFLNQVLEHVENPNPFIDFWSKYLSEDGVIYIEVPNQDYRFKQSVFPHTLFFSYKSLKNVLFNRGFEILSLYSFGSITSRKDGTYISKLCKLKVRLYSLCLRLRLDRIARIVDSNIYGYKKISNKGSWLFAIVRNNKK